MLTYDIKQNLTTYLQSIHLSIAQLEKLCGFSTRYFNNVRFRVPDSRIDTILLVLPDLNRQWLLYGEGQMTNNLPQYSSKVDKKVRSKKYRSQFFLRVSALLEMEGYTVWQFEEKNGLKSGYIREVFDEDDQRAIDTLSLMLLREYPQYSFDWLFLGKGPAQSKGRELIPVISSPSYLQRIKDGLESSDADIKDNRRALTQARAIRAMADCRYVSVGTSGIANKVSFAIEILTESATPYLYYRDIALCQNVKTPFGDNWDYRAVYLVEIKRDAISNKPKDSLRLGYLEKVNGGIMIYPVHNFPDKDIDTNEFREEEIVAIAKVVGSIRYLK